MTQIRTCSFREFRSSMGQPVVTSLRVPKWKPEAEEWPVCHLLTPRWSYFHAEEAEFDRQYVGQLDRFGPQKIRGALEKIAAETGATTLVLLCHEADPRNCHRQLFIDWAKRHGWDVSEATLPGRKPVERGPFREADEQGRQIVMIGRYSYAWPGETPLAVGDRVVLPGNRWRPEEREAEVTAIGSDYAGELVEVLRLAGPQNELPL